MNLYLRIFALLIGVGIEVMFTRKVVKNNIDLGANPNNYSKFAQITMWLGCSFWYLGIVSQIFLLITEIIILIIKSFNTEIIKNMPETTMLLYVLGMFTAAFFLGGFITNKLIKFGESKRRQK